MRVNAVETSKFPESGDGLKICCPFVTGLVRMQAKL